MSAPAYQFTASAEADVNAILAYTLETWGDAQAEAYVGGLFDLLGRLSARPESGRLRQELPGSLRSFPYREHIVFYTVFRDAILVIRVLHARQNTLPAFFDT
ncbi:type II toxin-antitoxin system RelE/ParE family toxin [Rhizobium sp. TRM96647]|uniref:type II toxin-antitoxin system RelE/ParE family toxin n=1 Tax=unclassified Rhizobium TaxID=2613769 RepID=UPI003994F949